MKALLRRVPGVRRLVRSDLEPPRTWDGPATGPRVLVEEEDSVLREAMTDALQEAGYRAAGCRGPGADGHARCPLVEGHGCGAIDDADAVVQVLVASDEPMNEVRASIREHAPDLAITVITPAAAAARHPELVEGTSVWTGPFSRGGVVAAVGEAIGPP